MSKNRAPLLPTERKIGKNAHRGLPMVWLAGDKREISERGDTDELRVVEWGGRIERAAKPEAALPLISVAAAANVKK